MSDESDTIDLLTEQMRQMRTALAAVHATLGALLGQPAMQEPPLWPDVPHSSHVSRPVS